MPIVGSNGKSTKPPVTPALSSEWGGLSPHLIATLYEVDIDGKRVDENVTVKAPLVGSATLSMQMQWQSPFESSGAESKAPMLMAMLQSGALIPFIDSLKLGDKVSGDAKTMLKDLSGRNGLTKLNSTQTFSGMPPLDYPITLFFRAWKDPATEVMKPFNQLVSWALPQKLAGQSTLLSRAADYVSGTEKDLVNVLLPSLNPVMLAINYAGITIKPVVIESISYETLSPKDNDGNFVSLEVQVKINSLTALDKEDWKGYRTAPSQPKSG
jgi:hypothetical protein